jgi:hypothetical protein
MCFKFRLSRSMCGAKYPKPSNGWHMKLNPSTVTPEQLAHWANECLSIKHLNTLVQREIQANSLARATDLSERARKRAWQMLNEMFVAGAIKPEGYCDPGTTPKAGDET